MPRRADEYLKQLAKVPMFRALSKRDLALVKRNAEDHKIRAGESLVKEGARGHEFFIIIDGRASVRRKGKKIGTVGPGDYFGELALLDPAPRNASVVADSYLSPGAAVQLALPRILESAPTVRAQLRERIARNRSALAAARTHASRWSLLDSEGGWYAVLRVQEEPSEEERCLRLAEAGVLVQPGYFYDFPSGAHLVLSLIVPPDEFERALPALLANLG